MNVEELHEIAATAVEEREKFDYEINVCMGTGCLSQHSDKVKAAIEKEAAELREEVPRAPYGVHGIVRGGADGADGAGGDSLRARA